MPHDYEHCKERATHSDIYSLTVPETTLSNNVAPLKDSFGDTSY
jgi:hypothetical protein